MKRTWLIIHLMFKRDIKPKQESWTEHWSRRQRRVLRLRRDNMTLTFDLLTPKPNQFMFVPRCTNDKSLAKIH